MMQIMLLQSLYNGNLCRDAVRQPRERERERESRKEKAATQRAEEDVMIFRSVGMAPRGKVYIDADEDSNVMKK
jgi:hypothetical protein